MEGYISTVLLWASVKEPSGWFFCDGRLLSTNEYAPLFSLIGTIYGGDGITTFALPDLRSRVPVCVGQGNGLDKIVLGQVGGAEKVTLHTQNLPAHNHTAQLTSLHIPVNSVNGDAEVQTPSAGVLANTGSNDYALSSNSAYNNGVGITGTIQVGQTGNNEPFSVQQPFVGMNYIICVSGYYPRRD